MKFHIVCIALLLAVISPSFGQTYKYIGVTEGLSDRRVLSIQKDKVGFMWFLTYTGIDRYDGKNIKHYRLQSNDGYVSFYSEKNILKTDKHGQIWATGPEGELFKYIPFTDKFSEIALPPEILSSNSLNLVKITDFDEVWYCHNDFCYIYYLETGEIQRLELDHRHKYVTSICQADKETYYIGTNDGICKIIVKDGKLESSKCLISNEHCQLPHTIFFHSTSNRIFAGSETTGMIVYDLTLKKLEKRYDYLKDFPITSFHAYNENQILIPTRGAGVQLYDLQTEELEQFLYADFHKPNKMNGNNIRSLYIDNHHRIWLSVYARSITVFDETLPDYKWFKHHIGNPQSLNDDLVNAVLEDSEGDIWYATNNGISLYQTSDSTWTHLLSWDKSNLDSMRNSIFLSLCETEPGTIVAGGFMTGVYSINKKTMNTRLLTPQIYTLDVEDPTLTNKYIRVIYRDKEGLIWTGGNNYLGCTNNKTKEFKHYRIGNAITCIIELNSNTLLIGTGNGLYKLDKRTGKVENMRMPFASQQINSMYLHPNGDLYIGTTNSGLVILRTNGEYEIYLLQHSALLSNTINTIVPKNQDEIIVATEQNIALYNNHTKKFSNWTEDQGLIKTNFNPRAGIHTTRGTFIFGSNNGAVEWMDNMRLPRHEKTEILFDQILIENQHAPQNTINRANAHDLDSINELHVEPGQRAIAIHISTVDYNSPQYTYFQWKLAGRYDYWNKLGKDNWLQFRNLSPGEHILTIQNIASEDYRILGERRLKIIVKQTFWQSKWAWLIYFLCGIMFLAAVLQYLWYKKERKISSQKDKLLIDTVKGIRIPLTLAQNAMSEVMVQLGLSAQSLNYLQTAHYSMEKLNIMTTNLLNIEKMRKNRKLQMEPQDVNKLIQKSIKAFTPLTEHDNICFEFISQEEELYTWIDVARIELIVYNLMSNLIRQTLPNRIIYLSVYKNLKRWGITFSNNRELMSVPLDAHTINKQFQHMNAEELETELRLMRQLVKRHHGALHHICTSPNSHLFSVSFPTKNPHYIQPKRRHNKGYNTPTHTFNPVPSNIKLLDIKELNDLEKLGSLLIVDETREAINLLRNSLSKEWRVSTAQSTSIALKLIDGHKPDIIIASTTSEIGEKNLCTILKSHKATWHIPIILIISDEDKEAIHRSFTLRADHYVTKPYDLFIIKAILYNILESQRQLQARLSKTNEVRTMKSNKQVRVERESTFMVEVKQVIESHIEDAEFGVDELCAQMKMSRTNLYSKVKSLTNHSLNTLIRDIRMQRAKELLLDGSYNVTEVCDRLGFSEVKYFREVFKKYYGVTPSDYIKQFKEK